MQSEPHILIRGLGAPGDLGWVVMAYGELYAALARADGAAWLFPGGGLFSAYSVPRQAPPRFLPAPGARDERVGLYSCS
jgi:hypothetical protein